MIYSDYKTQNNNSGTCGEGIFCLWLKNQSGQVVTGQPCYLASDTRPLCDAATAFCECGRCEIKRDILFGHSDVSHGSRGGRGQSWSEDDCPQRRDHHEMPAGVFRRRLLRGPLWPRRSCWNVLLLELLRPYLRPRQPEQNSTSQ